MMVFACVQGHTYLILCFVCNLRLCFSDVNAIKVLSPVHSRRGIYVRMLARKKAKLDTLSSDGSETTPSISPLDPPFSARAPSLKAKG